MSRQPALGRSLAPGSAVKLHNLRSFTESFLFGAFTDGGAAVGTQKFTNKIPKGAYFYACLLKLPAGFAGDTSAAITVGDGTDIDRYNTGTPDVFTTLANGVDMGVPSGALHHLAEKTVTVTITAGSDWGSVTAGQIIITMMYFGGPTDG